MLESHVHLSESGYLLRFGEALLLGILIGLEQLSVIIFGAATRSFSPFLPTKTFPLGGARVGYDQLIVFIIALAGTIGLTVLLRLTRLGASMRGVVDNDELIALTGQRPAAVRRWAWAIGCGPFSTILARPTWWG